MVGPSLKERVARLVSASAAEADRPTAGAADGKLEACLARGAAVPVSPAPESVPAVVLHPPARAPVPPYAPLRSAWPEAALVDLVKQQALFPTDVNVRVAQSFFAHDAGALGSSLLQCLADEAQINSTPSSAGFRFVQLLADVCSRASGAPASDQYALQVGQGPPPRPPALTAPAVAAAAAAAGRGPTPQLVARALDVPPALVGFEGDWLAVQPPVLPCWEKVSLEPCGPAKAAEFHVVCPEQHASAARMFAKDLSAAFTAMRLGSHTAARTPSHLHAIDGVIPVPLDPGPGPPQPASGPDDGGGGGAGCPSWQPLARRPDRMVVRSAILGFRSNHAPGSVGDEDGWVPDEPCYRARYRGTALAGAAQGQCPSQQPGPQEQQQPSQQQPFWRNLRHVGRQLQRHLLLPNARAGGGGGAGPGTAAGSGGTGGASPDDSAGETLGLTSPSLVVYVVPPTESPDDVARALLEVAACLAPATRAARAPWAAPGPPAAVDGASDGRCRRGQPVSEGTTTNGPCLVRVGSGVGETHRGGSTPPAAASAGTPGGPGQCGLAADAEDASLIARLGGAAKHLYRSVCTSASDPEPVLLGSGGLAACGSLLPCAPGPVPLSAACPSTVLDNQLDLATLPVTEVTVQLLLPSVLYDIAGSGVRATACAVYSKLCRYQAWYGAAAAGPAAAADLAGSASQAYDNGVQASCSGRTTLHEPLIALAPAVGSSLAGRPQSGGAEAHTPTSATPGAKDPVAALDPALSSSPTLHGCYAWRRCFRPTSGCAPGEERAWVAMAFSDTEGRMVDSRALMLVAPACSSDGGMDGGVEAVGSAAECVCPQGKRACRGGCAAGVGRVAPSGPPLEALVCRAVLAHARLLSQQLAMPTGCGGSPASSEDGAVEAETRMGLTIARLGAPTLAEAVEWQDLLSAEDAEADHGPVRLAWLEPHPSVAVPPGTRLPQGGFALTHINPSRSQPPNGYYAAPCDESAPLQAPVTLCAFPAQQPPSLAVGAAEALNCHVRLMSVHPFAAAGNHGVGAGQLTAEGQGHDLRPNKRRRLKGADDVGAPPAWAPSSLSLPVLTDLHRLCALRDALALAQSVGRSGGSTWGCRSRADAEPLLPWHAAVCQRLLSVLLAAEALAAASSGPAPLA